MICCPSNITSIEKSAFDKTGWMESWKNSSTGSDFLVVGDDYENADFKDLTEEQIKVAKEDLKSRSVEYDETELEEISEDDMEM